MLGTGQFLVRPVELASSRGGRADRIHYRKTGGNNQDFHHALAAAFHIRPDYKP
jgi:hypothetical protein